jgi:FkbM family methyltransferase
VRAAVGAVPGNIHEVRAAIHCEDGSIDLPVEPGGMAAGGRPGVVLEGLETLTFETATLETIARRLNLARMDLVKSDVEGAEIALLDGAWTALRRFRPQLAISIYHQPSHFIDIPLRIAAELPSYRFFLRSYHFISNETILYAIPKERPVKPRSDRIKVALV